MKTTSPIWLLLLFLTANRSLDQLDDLLTRQAKLNLPAAPPLTLFTVLGEQ